VRVIDEIEIEHTPTESIPTDMPYQLKCKCGNITMACDEPIPDWIVSQVKNTPCSKCVKPSEYIKRFK